MALRQREKVRGENWPFIHYLNLLDMCNSCRAISLLLALRKPFFPSLTHIVLSCLVLTYPCQNLERTFGLTIFALCLKLVASKGALKVAKFKSVAILVLHKLMKCFMLLMFIHIWTKQVYLYGFHFKIIEVVCLVLAASRV